MGNLMEWDKIWAMNKAMIDPIAPRMTALLTDGLVPCVLEGAPPDEFMRSVHAHPKDESIGKKIKFYAPTVYLQADDAAALVAGEGKVVSIAAKLHLQGSVKSTKKKLTWLAD